MEDIRFRKTKNPRDKRRFVRYAVEKEGRTLLKGWKKCTVIDISSKGLGIRFHKVDYDDIVDYIDTGSTVYLEIPVTEQLETISVKGILKWISKEGDDCIGGIELFEELDGYKWFKLRSGTLNAFITLERTHKIYM